MKVVVTGRALTGSRAWVSIERAASPRLIASTAFGRA